MTNTPETRGGGEQIDYDLDHIEAGIHAKLTNLRAEVDHDHAHEDAEALGGEPTTFVELQNTALNELETEMEELNLSEKTKEAVRIEYQQESGKEIEKLTADDIEDSEQMANIGSFLSDKNNFPILAHAIDGKEIEGRMHGFMGQMEENFDINFFEDPKTKIMVVKAVQWLAAKFGMQHTLMEFLEDYDVKAPETIDYKSRPLTELAQNGNNEAVQKLLQEELGNEFESAQSGEIAFKDPNGTGNPLCYQIYKNEGKSWIRREDGTPVEYDGSLNGFVQNYQNAQPANA